MKANLLYNLFKLNKLNLILFSFLLHVFRVSIPYLEGRYYTLSLNKAISMVVNLRNIYDSLTISLRWVFRNLRRFGHKAAPVVPKPVDLTNSLLFIPECIFYILIVLNHLQKNDVANLCQVLFSIFSIFSLIHLRDLYLVQDQIRL